MIKITILNSNDKVVNVTIEGHADFSKHGSDIVCAGVSAIGVGCLNALYEISGIKPDATVREGYINLNCGIDDESQLIVKVMIIQLKSIHEEYNKYIKIINITQ